MSYMKKIDKTSAMPFYQQVAFLIKQDIENEVYGVGSRIPSELELGQMYDVSRIVVRQAVELLMNDGFLIKKRGKGTYVSMPQIVETFLASGSFSKSLRLQGIEPKTEVVSKAVMDTSKFPFDASELGSESGVLIERLRYADDKAVIFEQDYFSESYKFLLDADLTSSPIMQIIRDETGIIASSFEDIIEVSGYDSRVYKFLNVSRSSNVLKVFQKVLTQNNEVVYINIQFINTDLYKYAVRYGG